MPSDVDGDGRIAFLFTHLVDDVGQVSKMLSNGIGDGSLCCSGGPGFDTVAWVNVLPELVDGLSDRWSHGHAPPVL